MPLGEILITCLGFLLIWCSFKNITKTPFIKGEEIKMENKIPTMLTLKETAERTGLSYYCLRQLCLEDKIIHIKTGAKYLINFDKLIDYLNGTA